MLEILITQFLSDENSRNQRHFKKASEANKVRMTFHRAKSSMSLPDAYTNICRAAMGERRHSVAIRRLKPQLYERTRENEGKGAIWRTGAPGLSLGKQKRWDTNTSHYFVD